MIGYEHHHAAFKALILPHAEPELLYSGARWAEGPLWLGDSQQLLFSDIPENRILRWIEHVGVSELRKPASFSNGRARDAQGRVITCEHGPRRLTRTEYDGSISTLVTHYGGGRLNSPNDVIVQRDGSIWFTDPDYGILTDYEGDRAEREQAACNVFRIDPLGRVQAMISDMVKPNGLAFAPDERTLYVADSGGSHLENGPHHIRRFGLDNTGKLTDQGILAEVSPGMPDGIKVDEQGNVWSSAADGLHCYSPQGVLLGKIMLPQTVSNLCFGGPKRNRLFITATHSLYAVYVAVRGAL